MKKVFPAICTSGGFTKILWLVTVVTYLPLSDGFSQTIGDGAHAVAIVDSISLPREKAIEVFKIRSNRSVRIDKTRAVWVMCKNKKGMQRIKQANLTAIHGHEMTFRPIDKKFSDVTYTDSEIGFIGFTSGGRVLIALVSNIIIVSTLVIVCFLAVLVSPGSVGGLGGIDDILVPFRKDINFHTNRKWAVRIVEVEPLVTLAN